MIPETYSQNGRIADVYPNGHVEFFKETGIVRKSKHGVWKADFDDIRKARREAKKWAFKIKLPRGH